MKIQFQVKMQAKDLYQFLMYHGYHSGAGIFSVVLGVIAAALAVYNIVTGVASNVVIYVAVAALVVFYTPVSMWLKAKQQVVLSPVFKEPLTYILDEEQIISQQGEQESAAPWENIEKVRQTKGCLLLYTGKSTGLVWPKEAMGDQYQAVCQLIKEKVDPSKVRIK